MLAIQFVMKMNPNLDGSISDFERALTRTQVENRNSKLKKNKNLLKYGK